MDSALREAVRSCWTVRAAQAARQQRSGGHDIGTRGEVTAGKHLDDLTAYFADLCTRAGFPRDWVWPELALPGFYRADKKWDLVVHHEGRLHVAIELKSQFDSFPNNFNHRIGEAAGDAVCLRRAYENGLLGPVRPFIGYVLVIPELAESTRPVRVGRGVFPVDEVFPGMSYVARYTESLQRLVLDGRYDGACLLVTSAPPECEVYSPVPDLGVAHFATRLRRHLAAGAPTSPGRSPTLAR